VNLKTLKSDKDMRDTRVQNMALETSKFPTATFTATKVTGFDKSIPGGQEQTLQLTGMLDLHGVQKEVTWEVKARRDGNVITGLATTSFKYGDFNIPILNIANFVSVQDGVTLQATIVAQAS
jgi:polyisoprenoid-binding protein YceI